MSDISGVLAGGAIALVASLLTTWLAYGLEKKRRLADRLSSLHNLLGQQAAHEIFADRGDVKEILAKSLETTANIRQEMLKNPALLDLTAGYLEVFNAETVALRAEKEVLNAETVALRASADALRAEKEQLEEALIPLRGKTGSKLGS